MDCLFYTISVSKGRWVAQHSSFLEEAEFKKGDFVLQHDYFVHI